MTMAISALTRLEAWYLRQCNGDWEHRYGVTIGTLDNPGWTLDVDLAGTKLEDATFVRIAENLSPERHPEGRDWLECRIEEGKWRGAGGPLQLGRLVEEFVDWAERQDR